MTTTHTPGHLQVPEPYDDQCAVIVKTTGGQYAVAVGIRNPADARRLAACWNVCQGFDTEVLESILCTGETMLTRFQARTRIEETLIADRLKAIQERDAARAVLELAEGIAQRVIAATGFDESQVSDWRPVVRAEITGSVPAPPTPSEPEFCPGNLPKCKWVATEPCGSKCTTCGDTVPF